MDAIRTACIIPIALLSACGFRQTGQAPDQQGAEPTAPWVVEAATTPGTRSIPSGTIFHVRLEQTLDTRRNRAGDRFFATLTEPVVAHGALIPKGTQCIGHLTESKPSGRFRGRALLTLSLDSFELNGRRYEIAASRVARASGSHKKRNWIFVGGGSGVGATIGAIAGGPAGALIGAGSGAVAGAAGAAFTGRKNVRLPVETQLSFVLRSAASVSD